MINEDKLIVNGVCVHIIQYYKNKKFYNKNLGLRAMKHETTLSSGNMEHPLGTILDF